MTTIAIDVQPQQKFSRTFTENNKFVNVQHIVSELNKQALFSQHRVLIRSENKAYQNTDGAVMADNVSLSRSVVASAKYKLLHGLPSQNDYDYTVHIDDTAMHAANQQQVEIAGLIEWLHAQEASRIVIGGMPIEECLQTTVIELCMQGGWEVIVNLSACRGYMPETMIKAVCNMRRAGAKVISDTPEVLHTLFPYSLNAHGQQSKIA